jgi:predicted DsbA family dithiol-disulfide isomerase
MAFLESSELKEEVEKLAEDARKHGVTGVPLVIIDNKWTINGSQKSEVFIQVCDYVPPIRLVCLVMGAYAI